MAQCGIKKYDSLPGRVGFIDVDAARAALSSSFKRIESLKQKLDKAIILNKNGKRM